MTDEQLEEEVRTCLVGNLVEGYSHLYKEEYCFIRPAKNRYPFQFFWDTCFHAFILCSIQETDLAKRILQSLFVMQKENGFVGHVLYWDNILPKRATDLFQSKPGLGFELLNSHMSALIQPPLVAEAVDRVFQDSGDVSWLRMMYPKIKRLYDWLAQNRDFDGDGLISIITSFESGMDWKPSYDPVVGFTGGKANLLLFLRMVSVDLRHFILNYDIRKVREAALFNVKDAGFNTIYAKNLEVLSHLGKLCNDPDYAKYEELSKKVSNSILEKMYDGEHQAFFDLNGKTGEKIKIYTPTIFFPCLLKDIPSSISSRVVERHFFQKDTFRVPYPLPSVAIDHPAYNPGQSLFLWRGPTWVSTNWFMHKYFSNNGHPEVAAELIRTVKELIHKSGFREYYHPHTGEGGGAKKFTWSGLVLDMMRNEEKNVTKKPQEELVYRSNENRR